MLFMSGLVQFEEKQSDLHRMDDHVSSDFATSQVSRKFDSESITVNICNFWWRFGGRETDTFRPALVG